MNKLKIIPIVIVAFFASACDDYLDVIPDSLYTIDKSFNLRMEAEKFLFTCYSYMPRQSSPAQNPALTGGDEIIISTYYRDTSAPTGWYISKGMNNVSNPYNDYWRGTNSAQALFKGIRDCNIFLENIGRVPDMEDYEKERWAAEVKFLKAYYHYYLVRMYGPIPIKDVNIEVEAGTEEVKVYRNTLDECFDYIVNTLDEVIESGYLPKFIENRAAEMGRITSTIALALKAEVLVTAASPLFNGNTDYTGFVDNRGIEIFNPNKSDEEKRQRWVKAAEACKAAIDSCHAIGHTLYDYTLTEYPGISDDTRAKLTIRNAMTEKWNSEIVWANTQSWIDATQQQAIPRGLEADKIINTLYCSNFAVPLKIAAQFYTKNGLPITEDPAWDYENRFAIRTATAAEGSLMRNGYKSAEFNFDREIRYYADLAFDGGVWFGQGKTTEATAIYVQCKAGQIANPQVENSFNETCIWPKKIVHPKTVVGSQSGITLINYPYPLMRLAGLYLLYAEALNEAEGPNGPNSADLFFYIDKVRERAKLKGVKDSWAASTYPTKFTNQRGMREIIQQERTIELVFESQRFWDLRRWKTAPQELTKPITGWNRVYDTAEDFYKEKYISTLSFTARDYFWPISEDEISRDANILQNYGW